MMLVLMPSWAYSVHTLTPTPTISLTSTTSATYTLSPSMTQTFTASATWSPTHTKTRSPTVSPTATMAIDTLTESLTLTYSATHTQTPTTTPTNTVTQTFTRTPTGVLPPPTGLTATCGDKTVSLTWQGQPGHVVFNVYRGEVLPAGPAMETSLNGAPQIAQTYQDVNLINGTIYDYAVRGGDDGGSFSGDSKFVFAIPAPPPIVPGPGAIVVSQDEGENVLAFPAAVKAAGGFDPEIYEIMRSDDGGNQFEVLGVLSSQESQLEYIDIDIDPAVHYWYTVRVSDDHGFCPHTAVYPSVSAPPLDFRLIIKRNRINPDLGETVQIRLGLLEESKVRLVIYSGSGLRIISLADESSLAAGEHKFSWDGRNRTGSIVVSGVYLIHAEVQSGSGRKSLKGFLAVIR